MQFEQGSHVLTINVCIKSVEGYNVLSNAEAGLFFVIFTPTETLRTLERLHGTVNQHCSKTLYT